LAQDFHFSATVFIHKFSRQQCTTVVAMFVPTLLSLAAVSLVALTSGDEDVILPPVYDDASLPQRLLVFIPGADVATSYYTATAQAIQQATTGLRLHVVIPTVTNKLCIAMCASSSLCAPLHSRVADAVSKSTFTGTNQRLDTFVAGHSMGSVCANNLVYGYSFDYAGMMAFGGYVSKTGRDSVEEYPIPVLHLAGELDGGGARPGKLAYYYSQSKAYGAAYGQDMALQMKPVHVLPGMDHSDFCPGFFVTAIKDIHSEVTQSVAMSTIGQGVSAFLHLNSPTDDTLQNAAKATMSSMLQFTSSLLEPVLKVLAMEQGSWCELAQKQIAGLSSEDAGLLQVEVDAVTVSAFSTTTTSYTLGTSGLKVTTISTAEPTSGFGPTDNHEAAESVDCQMVGANRVAQQLNVQTDGSQSCQGINKVAEQTAFGLMTKRSQDRYLQKARGLCFLDDSTVAGNIGPLFLDGSISLTETSDCLQVTSLALNTSLSSLIFKGEHYCKLLSPAMAMEWMMTDGLKPYPYHALSEVTI